MTKFKRHCAGYYTTAVATTVDGKAVAMNVELVRVEGTRSWYWTMEKSDGLQTEPGDHYPTKRDAVESMDAAMARGWTIYPGLGLCVN